MFAFIGAKILTLIVMAITIAATTGLSWLLWHYTGDRILRFLEDQYETDSEASYTVSFVGFAVSLGWAAVTCPVASLGQFFGFVLTAGVLGYATALIFLIEDNIGFLNLFQKFFEKNQE